MKLLFQVTENNIIFMAFVNFEFIGFVLNSRVENLFHTRS